MVCSTFQKKYKIEKQLACFLAGGEPRFERVVRNIGGLDEPYYIIPYLLFSGYLTHRITAYLNAGETDYRAYRTARSRKYSIARPLGIHDTIVERFAKQVLRGLSQINITYDRKKDHLEP